MSIIKNYPITDEEYTALKKLYGGLIYFIGHRFIRGNNGCHFEFEDVVQELWIAALNATSYYKRQAWVESSFDLLNKDHPQVTELWDKWQRRTKHGAWQVIFGEEQERELEALLMEYNLPSDKNIPLDFSGRFAGYLKAICWNKSRSLGKGLSHWGDLQFLPIQEVLDL